MKKALVLAAALLALATTVYADNSMLGPTGLIWAPTDQVAEKSELNISGSYRNLGGSVSAYTAGATYGLLPKLELGVSYFDFSTPIFSADELLVNAKYNIFAESDSRPGLSVGVTDIFSKLYDDPSFYIVAGKQFGALRATLGFGTEVHKGLFGGVQWDVTDKFGVFGEYVHELIFSNTNAFNVGAQYKINDKFSVKAGVLDMDDFFVGVNFSTSAF